MLAEYQQSLLERGRGAASPPEELTASSPPANGRERLDGYRSGRRDVADRSAKRPPLCWRRYLSRWPNAAPRHRCLHPTGAVRDVRPVEALRSLACCARRVTARDDDWCVASVSQSGITCASLRNMRRTALRIAARVHRTDAAATEEPLEIRLGASPFVVIMRTPGHDRELAAGFLFSERIAGRCDDIAAIRHCTDTEGDPANVVKVWLTGESASRATQALSHRRAVASNSSCGSCGRRSIDDLLCNVRPSDSTGMLAPDVIAAMPTTLRAAQKMVRCDGRPARRQIIYRRRTAGGECGGLGSTQCRRQGNRRTVIG